VINLDEANGKYDILDRTRLHQESYSLALKVAADAIYNLNDGEQVEKIKQVSAVRELIGNREKLRAMDITTYQK
jgi:transcriptional accessory protein Tex/SPT6